MATATGVSAAESKPLGDPQWKRRLQQLCQTDNFANWFYLARAWLLLALAVGGALWFFQERAAAGWSWWWNLPVTLLAVVVVGAGQHQLSGLGHEAAHHMLFRNRLLNELVSDWCCMFPLFSSTHLYRLQHLAHHQFVNDPEHDPDVSQLKASGHWHRFPVEAAEAYRLLLSQLWIPNLVRFMRVRARYNALADFNSPYAKPGWKPSRRTNVASVVYLVVQVAVLKVMTWLNWPVAMAATSLGLWLTMVVAYSRLPERCFHQSRLHSTISSRVTTISRLTFLTLLVNALGWTTYVTGVTAVGYFLLLWVVPLFTSFAFFMVLRQLVQHANGDRGLLSNTRVFVMNPVTSFCVFPIGQDYHLPHHLYSTIPHYRLKQLHELLLENPDYREQAVVVEGYLGRREPPSRPTVIEVLGPRYAPRGVNP